MKICYLNYFRKGRATNSSSTHSVIYKNKDEIFQDLNVFEEDYYDRYTQTIAASREAKIKYVYAYVFHDEVLSKMLMGKYPEMKQYKELADKARNSEDCWGIFGGYSRGSLHPFDNDISVSYQMLCNIIDNPEIVIIGGSDETDFVYDTCTGHEEINDVFTKGNPIKNGNYYFGYSYDGDKIRLSVTPDRKLIPKHPELIDLLITKKCFNNCPMCYNNSNNKGKHASLETIQAIVRGLKIKTEFSIGGGDILLHPQIKEILSFIKEQGHIVNITVHVNQVHSIINTPKTRELFDKCVDGIGISVFEEKDLMKYFLLCAVFPDKDVVMHLIPEMLGMQKMCKFKEIIHDYRIKSAIWPKILFLGYKQTGRATKEIKPLTDSDLNELMGFTVRISIDTSFAFKYKDWLSKNVESKSYTVNEGEFSMYIDAITATAYTCSYDLSKPHPLTTRYDTKIIHNYEIDETFKTIRKENGYEVEGN